MKPKPTKHDEKILRELFKIEVFVDMVVGDGSGKRLPEHQGLIDNLKRIFLSSLASQREEILEKAEGMRKNHPSQTHHYHNPDMNIVYDEAIDDIINLIKNL